MSAPTEPKCGGCFQTLAPDAEAWDIAFVWPIQRFMPGFGPQIYYAPQVFYPLCEGCKEKGLLEGFGYCEMVVKRRQ